MVLSHTTPTSTLPIGASSLIEPPAQLNSISSLPNWRSTAKTAAFTLASLVTSVRTNSALAPMSLASAAPAFSSISAIATFAPSRANNPAAARPIPHAPPLISATRPARRATLLVLDVGGLNDRRPLGDLGLDVSRIVRRAAADRQVAEIADPLDHLWVAHGSREFRAEASDNLLWRTLRRKDTPIGRGGNARQPGLRESRHIRHRGIARVAGDGERPQRAGIHERPRRRDAGEHHLHVPTDQVVHGRPCPLVGHMLHIDACDELQELAAKMRRGPDPHS